MRLDTGHHTTVTSPDTMRLDTGHHTTVTSPDTMRLDRTQTAFDTGDRPDTTGPAAPDAMRPGRDPKRQTPLLPVV